MSSCCSVTVYLGVMVKNLYAGLHRSHIALANSWLKVHEHLRASSGVQFSKVFDLKRELPADRSLERLMTSLLAHLVVGRKCHANRNAGYCLLPTSSHGGDVLCD